MRLDEQLVKLQRKVLEEVQPNNAFPSHCRPQTSFQKECGQLQGSLELLIANSFVAGAPAAGGSDIPLPAELPGAKRKRSSSADLATKKQKVTASR
jgi:hypothetical protein